MQTLFLLITTSDVILIGDGLLADKRVGYMGPRKCYQLSCINKDQQDWSCLTPLDNRHPLWGILVPGKLTLSPPRKLAIFWMALCDGIPMILAASSPLTRAQARGRSSEMLVVPVKPAHLRPPPWPLRLDPEGIRAFHAIFVVFIWRIYM